MTCLPRYGLALFAGTLVMWGGGGEIACASAGAEVRLALVRPVPFSDEEIGSAVAARLALTPYQRAVLVAPEIAEASATSAGARGDEVLVGPSDGASVRVRWRDRLVFVPVGERQGAPAARVVALVIADLASDDPVASVRVTAPASGAVDATDARGVPRLVVPPPAPRRLTLVGGVVKGALADEPLCLDMEADLAGPAWRRVRFGAGLGLVLLSRQSEPTPDGFSYTSVVARLFVVWRVPSLEVLAGPFASPYALGGASDHRGVLLGGSLGVRLAPLLTPRLRLVVGARADGYANRVHVTWTTRSGFATPRVAAALTVGVAWEIGS